MLNRSKSDHHSTLLNLISEGIQSRLKDFSTSFVYDEPEVRGHGIVDGFFVR